VRHADVVAARNAATQRPDDGYQVVTCQGGTAALACIQTAVPTAVLLDVRLDAPAQGWRLREEMQGDPALAHALIIVATADAHRNSGAPLAHRASVTRCCVSRSTSTGC
jgi:hypothetical protein